MKQPEKKLNAIQLARIERLSKIQRLAMRVQGVSYDEIGCCLKTVYEDIKKMISDGVLHRRTPTGGINGKGARFFANLSDADAFFGSVRKLKGTPAAARVTGPAHLDGEPDFSKAKYTIATPPVRMLRTNTHSNWG